LRASLTLLNRLAVQHKIANLYCQTKLRNANSTYREPLSQLNPERNIFMESGLEVAFHFLLCVRLSVEKSIVMGFLCLQLLATAARAPTVNPTIPAKVNLIAKELAELEGAHCRA